MLPTIRYIKIGFVKNFLAFVLAMGAYDRLQNPTEVLLREEPCTVPRAGASRREALRRAGTPPGQSGSRRNEHLFSHP